MPGGIHAGAAAGAGVGGSVWAELSSGAGGVEYCCVEGDGGGGGGGGGGRGGREGEGQGEA